MIELDFRPNHNQLKMRRRAGWEGTSTGEGDRGHRLQSRSGVGDPGQQFTREERMEAREGPRVPRGTAKTKAKRKDRGKQDHILQNREEQEGEAARD